MKPESRKLILLHLFLGTFLLAQGVFAEDVQISIQPELISRLDRATLKVEFIDAKGKDVEIPKIDGLDIRYQGQSSETRIVNFKSSSKTIHTYVVTPKKTGDYIIGPVKARFKGGEKTLQANLRVVEPKDDPEAQQIAEVMFAHISASSGDPFVQQPFDLTLKVYIRGDIQIAGSFGLQGGMPESGLDGELEWDVSRGKREEINGTIFNTYILHTTTKALTAGNFTFQPGVQVNVVIPRQRRRSYGFDDPFFGDFFGRQETRPIVLDCNQIEVEVKPIPVNSRPESFTGGVGLFDFDVQVGPAKVMTGEPITVKMRIYGEGNLSKITPPSIEENHEFKLYEARTVSSGNSNEVLFEQVMIPKSDAITHIPEIEFSYFNTQTADFRTISRGPFPVTVEAAPQQTAQIIATVPGSVQQETQIIGRDIVYLKPVPKCWRTKVTIPWYRTKIAYVLLPLPALLLIITAIASTRINILKRNPALARRQQAPKVARKYLQKADRALKKQDHATYYEALWNTLTAYFGHRLNLPPGEVTPQKIGELIPEEIESINQLFCTIEQRRYGSDKIGTEDLETLKKQITTLMHKCERMKI
ncbi:MAG TPA: BatD family protein [Pontiella sp.]